MESLPMSQDTTQKITQKSPVADLSPEIKEELRTITSYICATLPSLGHIIMHDVACSTKKNIFSLLSQKITHSYTPYKLLVITKPSDDPVAIKRFGEKIRIYCARQQLSPIPEITIIREPEFLASMELESGMIAESVKNGRIIVDVEVEKDWIWND